MATDDISLRVGMGRLEIEPSKPSKNIKEENPFLNLSQRKLISKTLTQTTKCACLCQKRKNVSICKKKHKLLKDPVLRLSQSYNVHNKIKNECQYLLNKDIMQIKSIKKCNADNVNLHTLVDNCNQLSISSDKSHTVLKVNNLNDCSKWWKCEVYSEKQLKESNAERSSSGSCSQEALNPPCDVTIDELASYFETLVHIPKKMSSMAEMMYI
ncbi:unnamed protein product [Euphydryas editha]|uniref:Oxidative stress-responsive serine-rich protein 1 n=1 Tax=Euphydryas editha TaxID=104508 RepID=A0AAU9U0B9_EUPED|nr:unnamed protein product [Euphydryas editha]